MSDKLLDFGATGGGGGGITQDVKWVESRYFIKVSEIIKPVGKDEPTIANIENYAKNKNLVNLIAYWNGTDSVYFLGNKTSSGQNQALHIGWRDNQRFTVAFYGNDTNFDLLNNHYADKVVGTHKWIHVAVMHNASRRESTLWINGMNYGKQSHPNGNYGSNMDLVFGARNTAKLAGFMSHFRLFVTASKDNISYNCARFYELEKWYFSGNIV